MDELSLLEKGLRIWREYQVELTLLSVWTVVPVVFTFTLIQTVKRSIAGIIKRRMVPWEIQVMHTVVSVGNTWFVFWALLPDASLRIILLNAVAIAIVYERLVWLLMRIAKKRAPALYQFLRADRRKKQTVEFSAGMRHDDNTTMTELFK